MPVVFIPETTDIKYDDYLQQTLGRCLPAIITDTLKIKPGDPIDFIAMALHRAAEDQRYIREKIKFLEDIVRFKREKEEDRTEEFRRYLRSQPAYLQKEYQKHRRQEQKCLKWLLKNEKWIKEARINAEKKNKRSKDFSRNITEQVSGILVRTQSRMKDIYSERRKEKKHKQGDGSPDPYLFISMMKRWQNLHITAAKEMKRNVSKEKVQHKKSKEKVWTTPIAELSSSSSSQSSDSSIYCRYTENSYDSSSSDLSAKISKKRQINWAPERLDRQQRRWEKMRAVRMIEEAVHRGEYQDTDDGIRIEPSRKWKALGLKPIVERGKKKRCNKHTQVAQIWEEEKFNCNVFYDPELYTVCPSSRKKWRLDKLKELKSDKSLTRVTSTPITPTAKRLSSPKRVASAFVTAISPKPSALTKKASFPTRTTSSRTVAFSPRASLPTKKPSLPIRTTSSRTVALSPIEKERVLSGIRAASPAPSVESSMRIEAARAESVTRLASSTLLVSPTKVEPSTIVETPKRDDSTTTIASSPRVDSQTSVASARRVLSGHEENQSQNKIDDSVKLAKRRTSALKLVTRDATATGIASATIVASPKNFISTRRVASGDNTNQNTIKTEYLAELKSRRRSYSKSAKRDASKTRASPATRVASPSMVASAIRDASDHEKNQNKNKTDDSEEVERRNRNKWKSATRDESAIRVLSATRIESAMGVKSSKRVASARRVLSGHKKNQNKTVDSVESKRLRNCTMNAWTSSSTDTQQAHRSREKETLRDLM